MRAFLFLALWVAIGALGAFGIRRIATTWARRACLALWLLVPALSQIPILMEGDGPIGWVLVLIASLPWWFGVLMGWMYKPTHRGDLATKTWGCGWRGILLLVTLTVLGLFAAFDTLREGGAFSPKKCEENGGVWNHAIEVCE